jgi:hypothetical protein
MKKKKKEIIVKKDEKSAVEQISDYINNKNNIPKEIKVRCLAEHKDEQEDETISYEYLFMSTLEDNEDPTTKDFIELKIKTNSPKYEIQKYYYFTMMTKLRD